LRQDERGEGVPSMKNRFGFGFGHFFWANNNNNNNNNNNTTPVTNSMSRRSRLDGWMDG
tara:strand:+ start:1647 stop:1823 length:177 start_codon:yes stop_codon:yes gene_type:complete